MLHVYRRLWLAVFILTAHMIAPSALHAQAPSNPQDPGGWTAAKWGMTENQVLAAFRDQARKLAQAVRYGGGSFASVRIDSVEIGVITYRVDFIFQPSDSTLEAVNLAPADESPGIAAAAYDHLEQSLTQKYGQPGYRKDGDDARVTSQMVRKVLTWRLMKTEISLSYMSDAIMTMTRLVYRPVQALKETEDKL